MFENGEERITLRQDNSSDYDAHLLHQDNVTDYKTTRAAKFDTISELETPSGLRCQ